MTLKELSQLYYLDKEIELDRERLAELRQICSVRGRRTTTVCRIARTLSLRLNAA